MEEIKELSVRQNLEAGALYLHLLNLKEVQQAPYKPNEPMCKICNKTAKEILDDQPFMKKMSGLMNEFDEMSYNELQRLALLVLKRNEQIKHLKEELELLKKSASD